MGIKKILRGGKNSFGVVQKYIYVSIFFFFLGGGCGEEQWMFWNWSCDLRANERPKKTAPNGTESQTDKHIDGHRDSMNELDLWGRFSEKKLNFDSTVSVCCVCVNIFTYTRINGWTSALSNRSWGREVGLEVEVFNICVYLFVEGNRLAWK